MQTNPEWFLRHPFYQERLVALGVDADEYFRACDVLGLSDAIARKYLVSANADDITAIIDHAKWLNLQTKE